MIKILLKQNNFAMNTFFSNSESREDCKNLRCFIEVWCVSWYSEHRGCFRMVSLYWWRCRMLEKFEYKKATMEDEMELK